LNRALLARQFLLERSSRPLPSVVEGMGGIQMQYAPAGYVGLWSRMQGFGRRMLTDALEAGTVVQGTMMRATIHTVSAADYWPIMAGIARINREWYTKVQARDIGSTDLGALAEATRAELVNGPLRVADLTDRLVARGFPARAAGWAQLVVPMLRVPPSGTWERRRADLLGLAEQTVPHVEVSEDDGIRHLIGRYLGAFGPAPAKDIATWMGLNVGQIRHVLDAMPLRRFTDDGGRPLVDVEDAPLPEPERPAPPRFLAVWDAALLVHARRTEILPEAFRPRIFNTKAPHSFNTFLLDGQVAGTWRAESGDVELTPFRTLGPSERAALEEECHGLVALHAN
jgi:hypothetical protein